MKRFGLDPHSLPAQMILSFVALVFLTAVAVGLPAMWLIRDQLEHQAWDQTEQGHRAAQALYAARQSEINSLATLTAQRPTLRDLLAREETVALSDYIRTLKTGIGLDLALICGPEGQPVTGTSELSADSLCALGADAGFHVISADSTQVWLIAAHPIDDVTDNAETSSFEKTGFLVVVGITLNDTFAVQMRDQTGLEHTLLVDGEPVATSLVGGAVPHEPCRPPSPAVASDCQLTFSQNGAPYYAIQFPLNKPDIKVEVALPMSDIVATQRRLVWTLVEGILVIAVIGSGVGAYLSRRIGRPLLRLADAATALSKGDLSNPVTADTRVREVAMVAQALEGARADLERTLAQLRQEKAWTDHLLEAIVEGIVTMDQQGRITFFSHGAERITGWKRDQVLGRTCDQVFRPSETKEPFSRLIPPPGRRRKIVVTLHDGRQATLAITGAQLLPPEGGDARIALVFRDISEAQAIHRLLGHFLANIVHEFRTPLAAVAASAELLLDQAPDLSAAELDELLASLYLGVLGLQTLVDNLLESASIEAGHFRVSPRPSDLSDIIAEAIRTTQPLLDKRDQRLIVELPVAIPVVQADPRRTVQVLVNLISNANKYGPDKAEITIGATASAGWIRVSVANQGPSIPPEQQAELFRRFVRPVPSDDKTQHGAGLGLSVVKAVVEAHGGQVGVDDRPGGGSVFWFTLPRGHKQ